ncbi:MAG TPA: hypothetical protein PKY96_15260 [Flavobacteriales bacterium]|nr:hypothetical protein [Flavobacteriales bacterium]
MRATLLLFGSLLAAPLVAQLPTYGWTRSLGTLNGLNVVKAGPNGRLHAYGTFNGNHDLDLGPDQLIVSESGSSYGAFVCTAEADGTLAWAIALASSTNVNATGLHVSPDGSLLAQGNFRGILDADPSASGELFLSAGSSFDQYIGRYSTDGDLIWAVSFGNNNDLTIGVSALDGSGNVYLVLSPSGTLDVDPGPGTVNYGPNPTGERILIKLGPDGSFQWVRRIGQVNVKHLLVPNTGGIIAIGEFGNEQLIGTAPNAITISGNASLTDVFVIRFDPQGYPVQGVSFGGQGTDLVMGAALGPDGAVNMAGEFTGTTDLDPGPGTASFTAVGYDGYAVKLNADLEMVWGHAWDVDMVALALDGYGDLYLTGALSTSPTDLDPGPGVALLQSNISFNAFHLKLNGADGSFMHAFPASDGTVGHLNVSAIELSENGAILSVGAFRASTDMNPLGGDDILTVQVELNEERYIRRFEQAIGLGMPLAETPTMRLYPLPCEDALTVELPGGETAAYAIRDLQGRALRIGRLKPGPTIILVEALASGTYLLEVDGRAKRFIKR